MATSVHPTAIVEPGAQLGADVSIGPYCIVGPQVILGDRVQLLSHVVIAGHTSIGADTAIYPFASIGHKTQDLKYKGGDCRLEIGSHNQIREHVTMNPGTAAGSVTRVGDHGLFMMSAHVAHDCTIGDHVIMANNATLAGHVTVSDYVIVGGLSAVQQFVRIGAHAIIGGMSGVDADVIPYGLVKGERAHLAGLNMVGLERRGFSRDDIKALRSAYQVLFGADGTLADRVEGTASQFKAQAQVGQIVDFIRQGSGRPLCQPLSD